MDWVNPQYQENGDIDGVNPSLTSPISSDGHAVSDERCMRLDMFEGVHL